MMEKMMSENKFVFSTQKEKDWLKSILREGNVTVEFVKKDGSARTMTCTLKEDAIPSEFAPKGSTKAQSDETLAVFDVEAQGWRSFRWDSLTKISATL
jgi:hypothetical protein